MASNTMNKNMTSLLESLNTTLSQILTGALKGKYSAKAIEALQSEATQEKLATLIKEKMPVKIVHKSKKLKKDPEQPKRGCSSYIFFCKDARKQVKDMHDDWKATEVTAEIGRIWREDMTDEMKAPYIEQASTDKARYLEEMKDYTPSTERLAEVASHASDSEGSKKKRKKRKPGPKRACSAYIFFCKEMRDKVKEDNDDMDAKEVTSELGRLWREEYKDDSKLNKPFVKAAKKDKKRFEKEKAEWVDPEPVSSDAESGDEAPAPAPAPAVKKSKKSKKSSKKKSNTESGDESESD